MKKLIIILFLCSCGVESNDVELIIRPNANGQWELLDNAYHVPVNGRKVTTLDDRIVVEFKTKLKKITTFLVSQDETLTREGFNVGASCSINKIVIFLHKEGVDGYYNPKDAYYQNANVNILVVE